MRESYSSFGFLTGKALIPHLSKHISTSKRPTHARCNPMHWANMDFQAHGMFGRPKSNYSYFHEKDFGCSFKRCSCFVLLFLSLSVTLLGVIALVIVFALRPRKPIFALQAVRVESFKINGSDGPDAYVSSKILLLFNTQNPNKVGLRYSPSQLFVLDKGVPVGVANVPDFYQPAHSKNVSVQGRVMFEHVSLSQIAGGNLLKGTNGGDHAVVRIVGDITARVHAMHVTLPKIKVALDCEISMDYRGIILSRGTNLMKKHKAHFSNHPSFSKKCSLAVYL
ncbi:uncharacterized protein LOC131250723 [Magnolia sinica]|uniref:uncharacterized protein LOC131250723 n=1 Tax=Magnolia sinica TaxID=86752 RepID=UPI002657B96C|nr:uncharacterized protein LOC131250723 [Magnolia sinica]